MARIYCQQCGTPLARRTTVCLQCDTVVDVEARVKARSKPLVEWLAICCVAVLCLAFVVALGITNLFRDGGQIVGAALFVGIALSVRWVSYLERINGQNETAND
ncbi:MAG: hypothetical protein J7K75_11245 [Desulfuromonas sp.]|nr:hypothetical protein [Desulfuromonas sp.]